MFRKISRKNCLARYPRFPLNHHRTDSYFFPEAQRGYILTLSSRSLKGHAKALAKEIAGLVRAMGDESLMFLGDTETPWLYQENDYKPVHSALQYLSEKKVNDSSPIARTRPAIS